MTTLFMNNMNTYSTEQITPTWMREERYGYCEPTTQQTLTLRAFFAKLISLFL